MARNGSGVYSLPAGAIVATGDTIEASQHNNPLQDLETDANTARPIVAGGTGATTAADARTNLGLGTIATQAANSVNIDGGTIDGVTIGGNAAATGTFSTVDINGGAIDNTTIGTTTPTDAKFQTITITERLTNDPGENTPGVGNNAAGAVISTDTGYFSKGSGVALYVNRNGSNGVVQSFRRGGAEVGTISVTGSATAYNTSSDRRLKEDIADLTGAGERIDRLKPRSFVWRGERSRARGFIADEFQKVYPRSVTGEPNGPEMQAIDASQPEVIADLVAEIQSLRKRLAALEAQA